jgi:hypothetical protein
MIVLEIDIQGGFTSPAEGNPVIPAHPHRPSFRFALQAVEVEAGDIQLLRQARDFKQLQNANALPYLIGANPASLAGEVNLLKPLVPERANHFRSVDYLVYSVKCLRWGGRSLFARNGILAPTFTTKERTSMHSARLK